MPTSCVLCSKRLKVHQRRPVNKQVAKYLRKNFLLETTNNDYICGKCNRPAYRTEVSTSNDQKSKSDNTDTASSSQIVSPPSVCLKIKSVAKSHAYCCICKRPGPKLVVVPHNVRFDVFVKNNVIVSSGSRCCPVHFDSEFQCLTADAISSLKTVDHVYVNRTTLLDLLMKMRHAVLQMSAKRMTFDNLDTFSDEDLVNLTGLTQIQFLDLFQFVQPHIRNTPSRSALTTLGIFLLKIKSGISNKLLSTLFAISKSSIRRAFHTVRQALLKDFVPLNLGLSHVSREEVINHHTRKLAQSLFTESDDQVILVLDGTYIYIQKSNNFQFQRRSYSVHKGKPLVKPMVIVTTTGYFVTVMGPYLADSRNNDASILNHIMNSNVEQIKNWVKPNDIFIVDRGFRDSTSLLKDLGIQSEMPAFMVRGERQMTSEDANASRLVTKVRWVVEAANSRIKRWKYLDHILPTNQVPYIGDYVRIVCAISNKYSTPINPTQDSEEDQALATRMMNLAAQTNTLQAFVEENNLERRSVKWIAIDDNVINFPKLDEAKLRSITLGTYQLKLSSSYIQEYVEGDCCIHYHQETNNLIRVRLQSRHVSSKSYFVWIKYDENDVQGWYCRCRAGARTVGACSHVASVLWYLGISVHTQPSENYGVKDWGKYLQDASFVPDTIDSSDSEDSLVEE